MHGTQKSNHLLLLQTIGNNHRFFLIAIESSGFFSVFGGHKFCRELCLFFRNVPTMVRFCIRSFFLNSKFLKKLSQVIFLPLFKKLLRALALILNLDLFPSAYLFLFLYTHSFSVCNVMLSRILPRS